jgi:hypothetical protein
MTILTPTERRTLTDAVLPLERMATPSGCRPMRNHAQGHGVKQGLYPFTMQSQCGLRVAVSRPVAGLRAQVPALGGP